MKADAVRIGNHFGLGGDADPTQSGEAENDEIVAVAPIYCCP